MFTREPLNNQQFNKDMKNNWEFGGGCPDGLPPPKLEPSNQQIYFCALCNGPGTTKHHVVPKAIRKSTKVIPPRWETIRLCRHCHDEVHYYISHWELAVRFNSLEKIRSELQERKAVDVNH